MINSIKYFEEECISRFEKLEDQFLKHPEQMAEYVLGLTAQLHQLGLKMIQESLEMMNRMLLESPIRRRDWVVEAHIRKQLITSLGAVAFKKTLFTNKHTGESAYLIDRLLGLDKHERMTEDAEALLFQEAVQTSYRRGGESCSLTAEVSRQTVKNKIHQLEFPPEKEKPCRKKEVEYLYIDADEDHISLQFRKEKGDLLENENHQKTNCLLAKLIYVYEGIEKEAPKSSRHRLINPHYFCSVNTGKGNEEFWDEVYDYLDSRYDLKKVKKIYLNSDGGGWIRSGMKRIAGLVHVLDKFHLENYLTRLTSHLKDSRRDAAGELRRIIRQGTKREFEGASDCLKGYPQKEENVRRIEEASEYILSNWTAARLRLRHREGVVGSSTEAHVSHVLSARMSSRPMGWSIRGAEKMARLRAYYLNGGDMLELVRYQGNVLPKVAGAEETYLTTRQILDSEKSRHQQVGKYMESISHSLSLETKKKLYFNAHIWGL